MADRAPPRHTWTRRERALAGGAIGLVLGVALLVARGQAVLDGLEGVFLDLRTRAFAGARAPDPRIVVVEVQDEDVQIVREQMQIPWPWDLMLNATCVRVLSDAGARALLVDVFHYDQGQDREDLPSDGPPLTVDEEGRLEGGAASADDYGASLRAFGRAAVAFDLTRRPSWQKPRRVEAAAGRLAPPGLDPPPEAPQRPGADLPVRRVIEGARWLGFANVYADGDGVVRRAPVAGRWGERPVVSLALAGAMAATGEEARVEGTTLVLGSIRRPLHDDGTFLVDFRGPANRSFRRVAPTQLIRWDGQRDAQGRLPAQATDAIKDAIVVWGVNLAGQKDIVTTPISGRFRGPEFQATALDNLLNGGGRLLVPCAWRAVLLLLVLVGVGAWAPATHRRLAPHLIVLAAALFVGVVGVAGFAAGWVFDLATPWLGLLFTAAAAFTLRWATEGRYNRWLESAFGRYLSPSVIGAIKDDPGLLALGGRRREVTILFSDVAGFTQASRRLTPEQLVQLLNEYLQMHGQAVFDHDGLIDKFIGDAVMAIYGDPVPMPDHAVKACRSALAVQAGLPALEPLWRSMGLDAFKVRVGLNSGPASVGNMGSRDRLSYTAMGDTVNLASRLEGANKVFGTKILIGPQTWEQARDAMLCRPLGRVQVVGYDAPVPVHELVASLDRATDEQKAHVAAFVRAQAAARSGDRAAALAALDECDRIAPGAGPVAWFRSVLSRLSGPWSGDLTLDAK